MAEARPILMSEITNPEFSWRAHPARERPAAAVLAVGVIGAFSACAWILMQSPWWSLLAAGVFVLVLRRFFFPSRFEVDDEGVTARYPMSTRRIRWADVRGFGLGNSGGTLSTRSRPSVFGPNRSISLIFSPGEAPRVLPVIRARVAGSETRPSDAASGEALSGEPLEGSGAWG